MTVTVRNKFPIAIPAAVQRRAGIKSGDRLEFKVSAGAITILPKPPSSAGDYTPAQRRVIDAQIAEGLDDIRKGRVSPRFETVDEMLASLLGSPNKRLLGAKSPAADELAALQPVKAKPH
jgi:AbrB family looped-hinge helix DNA binding protein